jgi:hypothetical protein
MTRLPARRRSALGTLLLALLLAGCASPGGGASTDNDLNRCAAVLPTARQVVHGRGELALVRPINRGQLDTITQEVTAGQPVAGNPAHPHRPAPGTPHSAAKVPAGPKTCLVVYRGSFDAAAIPKAQPPGAHGQYALIVLGVRHVSVNRVLITDTLPAGTHRPWWHR